MLTSKQLRAVLPEEASAEPNKVGIPEFTKEVGRQQLHSKSPTPLVKQTVDDTTVSTIPETISTHMSVRNASQEEESSQQGQQSMALPASVHEESYRDELDTWNSDSEDYGPCKEDKPMSYSGDDIVEAEESSESSQADDSASESSNSSSFAAVNATSDLPWGFKSNREGDTEPIPELPSRSESSREIKNATEGDQAGLTTSRRGRGNIKNQHDQGNASMSLADMKSSWVLPLRTDLDSSWVNPSKAVDLDPTRPIFAEATPAAVVRHIGSTKPKPNSAGPKASTVTSTAAKAQSEANLAPIPIWKKKLFRSASMHKAHVERKNM
jgi:hypothetical protein